MDGELQTREVVALRNALLGTDQVFSTGLVLQELLQGFAGPKARDSIVERFTALAFVEPDRQDYIDAAEVRNTCRRNGVQIGTIDALLIQLSRRHDLQVMSTDNDFRSASLHIEFRLWGPTHG
jgi:predicted nucleic acid-binding protein